jgi:hypothetical protein
MADVVLPAFLPCKFYIAWRGTCDRPSDNGWCSLHEGQKCCVCGEQAVRQCEYAATSPLVCGALLCVTCEHEPYSRKRPRPSHHLTAIDFERASKEADKELLVAK